MDARVGFLIASASCTIQSQFAQLSGCRGALLCNDQGLPCMSITYQLLSSKASVLLRVQLSFPGAWSLRPTCASPQLFWFSSPHAAVDKQTLTRGRR